MEHLEDLQSFGALRPSLHLSVKCLDGGGSTSHAGLRAARKAERGKFGLSASSTQGRAGCEDFDGVQD